MNTKTVCVNLGEKKVEQSLINPIIKGEYTEITCTCQLH